jgi:hypothetical protein
MTGSPESTQSPWEHKSSVRATVASVGPSLSFSRRGDRSSYLGPTPSTAGEDAAWGTAARCGTGWVGGGV